MNRGMIDQVLGKFESVVGIKQFDRFEMFDERGFELSFERGLVGVDCKVAEDSAIGARYWFGGVEQRTNRIKDNELNQDDYFPAGRLLTLADRPYELSFRYHDLAVRLEFCHRVHPLLRC